MTNDALLIRRYLLGDLPEAEAAQVEEEYFLSDDRFGALLAAEDDLIEAFWRHKLNPGDRRLFEARFMATPAGQRKVALAEALGRVSGVRQQRPWAIPLAIAAALVLMLIGGALFRETLVKPQRPAVSVAHPAEKIYSLILSGAAERGSSPPGTIVLPSGHATVELWLLLPQDEYPTYTATLQSVDGRTLRVEHSLVARPLDSRKAVAFRIPSETLQPQTYVVTINGDIPGAPSEPIEDFSFSVRRP